MKLPQLSLRELFLLVALAAMGCGWWVREQQLAARIDTLKVIPDYWPTKPGQRLEISVYEDGSEFVSLVTERGPGDLQILGELREGPRELSTTKGNAP